MQAKAAPVQSAHPMDLYVYYKVPVAQAERVMTTVKAMQDALSREQDVRGALKRRPEPSNGLHTWMEIYRALPAGFDDTLARAVEQSGLADLIVGPRHLEYFMDVFACA